MQDNDFTKILGWPAYRVFHHEVNEVANTLRLWVRRKRRGRHSECGVKVERAPQLPSKAPLVSRR